MIGSQITQCRACGNQELVPVCDLGAMALTGIFPEKNEQAVSDGPLELVKCHGDPSQVCGLVQLRHSFDPRVLFGKTYGYRSGLNSSMREHLRSIADKVCDLLSLEAGDVVVDIGSSDGTLLGFFSGKKLSLFGVDPIVGQFKQYYADEVQVIPEFFSGSVVKAKLGAKKVRVVTAIALLYDLDAPLQFLEEVREILAEDGVCVLEQGYLPLMLENLAYDSICHEHAAYYRLKQIKWLADRAGLKIIQCEQDQTNGGSFCAVLAKKESKFKEDTAAIAQFRDCEALMRLDTLAPYIDFHKDILKHREALQSKLAALKTEGKRILGYGASTKGNVLLQFCGLTPEDISAIADVNEAKWGRVCPGTRIPIISEEAARGQDPDIFLVLPWHFKAGFLIKEKRFLQHGGAFLFPLPKIEILR